MPQVCIGHVTTTDAQAAIRSILINIAYVALIYPACLQHVGCALSVALLIQIAFNPFSNDCCAPTNQQTNKKEFISG